MIPHPWLGELFTAFCTSGHIPLECDTATTQIARAATACRRIAITVQNPSDLTTDALHAALGVEDLRRVAPLIAYMTQVGLLDWDRARLRALIEQDRVAAILTTHQASPHATLLYRYHDHLALRSRKPITQRTALTAAVALLETLGDAPLADLSQHHLAKTLRERPGHRAALQSLLSFIAAQGGPNLIPSKPYRCDATAQKRQLRNEIRIWRTRLQNPRNAAEARALLAVLIARMYDLPLARVLALRRVEVTATPRSVTLWPDADALTLSKPLASAFLRWIAGRPVWTTMGGPWVFSGRRGHQPLSEAAVTHHLARERWFDRPSSP